MAYEARLRNMRNQHQSDWCWGSDRQAAKNNALANYNSKYPGEDVSDAEYEVRPAH